MNIGFLILFLLFQMIVNYGCQALILSIVGEVTVWAVLASYLIASLIIAFVWGIMATPPGYRKEFYKQPGFHKNTLRIFLIFALFDIIWAFVL